MPEHIIPIVFETEEKGEFPSELERKILNNSSISNLERNILLNYPIVYIHYWDGKPVKYTKKDGTPGGYKRYNVYVGESNDVIQRTQEHYNDGKKSENWQHKMLNGKNLKMIVVGHEHFNKSFTLDVENRLIEYIMSMRTVEKLHNGRSNPQNSYYPSQEFDEVFQIIWGKLIEQNNDLFVPQKEILDSAIYKASPLKKLSQAQLKCKKQIINKVKEAYINSSTNNECQLVFVHGDAGTGKTVLVNSTFYEICKLRESDTSFNRIKCSLLVNHNEQLAVYTQMAERLGLKGITIDKPATFIQSRGSFDINNNKQYIVNEQKREDIVFIDEGHLMWSQGNQNYKGKNQLSELMQIARVLVVVFDEKQILETAQYRDENSIDNLIKRAKEKGFYIRLNEQFRMSCGATTTEWINSFIEGSLKTFKQDPKNYEVKSFDTPLDLQNAIQEKANCEDTKLSRIVATYDWPYKQGDAKRKIRTNDRPKYNVIIGNWKCPWNYQLDDHERSVNKKMAWAEQPHTINEIGSTYTVQGFDLSYVGVIIGPSVSYENNKVVFKPENSQNKHATNKRTLDNGEKKDLSQILLRNELRVLMTRGVKGLYIYACDENLRQALKNIAKI